MSERESSWDFPDVPDARTQPKSRFFFQVVWLIPLMSALIGGYIAVKAILDRGPVITVSFQNADGLEAGKTKLKYKDVDIGLVKNIALAKDLKQVVATAELVKDFGAHLVEDTRFWVVRPRVSGGTVSGLGTLFSGSYIGVDAGKSQKSRSDFAGLETPPIVALDTPGREFVLRTSTLSSVSSGSPLFFRRLQAGQVMSYTLDDDGKGVTVKVFINEPFDRYVNSNTRFWNASGVDLKIDAGGIQVEMESLVSLLVGGIAFETPEQSTLIPVANAPFTLFANRSDAMKNPEPDVLKFVMVFNESARGLSPGAPVDFLGIVVGEVAAVKVDFDPRTGKIIIPIDVNIYPDRMRSRVRAGTTAMPETHGEARRRFIDGLVARGLRAQMRSRSLLTGQLYIALDFFPNASKTAIDWSASTAEVPTMPGARQELEVAIASIAAKIDRFPLDQLGKDARSALVSADRLIKRVDTDIRPDLRTALQSGTKLLQRLDAEVVPEARDSLVEVRRTLVNADRLLASDAPLQHDTREAMREIGRAAQAFRTLADYIERHPEALLVGKKQD